MRDNEKPIQSKVCTTNFGLKSLRYSGAVRWNKLPVDLKACITFTNFKKNAEKLGCSVCKLCKIK